LIECECFTLLPLQTARSGTSRHPELRRFGDDAFAVFPSILSRPEGFVSKSTESLFGPLLLELKSTSAWAAYLSKRYGFVTDEPETAD
jgi:hypothetical protein